MTTASQVFANAEDIIEGMLDKAILIASREGPYSPEREALRDSKDLPEVSRNLARSLHWEKIGKGEWIIGSETEYGAFVELGTSRAPAYPYLSVGLIQAFEEIST